MPLPFKAGAAVLISASAGNQLRQFRGRRQREAGNNKWLVLAIAAGASHRFQTVLYENKSLYCHQDTLF
jgi:H+/Cl- antiporter ClcA